MSLTWKGLKGYFVLLSSPLCPWILGSYTLASGLRCPSVLINPPPVIDGGKQGFPYFITRAALDPVPCAVLCPSVVLTDTPVMWTGLSPH